MPPVALAANAARSTTRLSPMPVDSQSRAEPEARHAHIATAGKRKRLASRNVCSSNEMVTLTSPPPRPRLGARARQGPAPGCPRRDAGFSRPHRGHGRLGRLAALVEPHGRVHRWLSYSQELPRHQPRWRSQMARCSSPVEVGGIGTLLHPASRTASTSRGTAFTRRARWARLPESAPSRLLPLERGLGTEPGPGSPAGTVDTTCPSLRRARLGGGRGSGGPSLAPGRGRGQRQPGASRGELAN